MDHESWTVHVQREPSRPSVVVMLEQDCYLCVHVQLYSAVPGLLPVCHYSGCALDACNDGLSDASHRWWSLPANSRPWTLDCSPPVPSVRHSSLLPCPTAVVVVVVVFIMTQNCPLSSIVTRCLLTYCAEYSWRQLATAIGISAISFLLCWPTLYLLYFYPLHEFSITSRLVGACFELSISFVTFDSIHLGSRRNAMVVAKCTEL